MTLRAVALDDKYTLEAGSAFMSGVQALVRLPMLQRRRDALQGLNTAGFISGYRGSPLGGYDQALVAAAAHLQASHVVFQPGVNEELAATAVWGTQQLHLYPQSQRYDGVFGIWYGKGPGVDRSADVFKHANLAGTAPRGGVLAVAGDDHVSKSSTAAHQSDPIFIACGLPVFFPSNVQEILDLGVHALALSRFSGLWAGMKTIQEVVESSANVQIDTQRIQCVLPPDVALPAAGLHIRWPDTPLEQEARLMHAKWDAALAYVRANRLNQSVITSAHDRFGIITSGKAYNDTRAALQDLGFDESACHALGIRLHKVAVVWPLEPVSMHQFAQGLQEILVIEEKRSLIESQLKEALYNQRVRPRVVGKFVSPVTNEDVHSSQLNLADKPLLRVNADLNPSLVARAIASRLLLLGVPGSVAQRMQQHLDALDAQERLSSIGITSERTPWFCSGCPHNTSTRVPTGSRALAGIGCHYMALWMNRNTQTFSQMGGEGVAWVGQQPFCRDTHVFANLGDGTYFHSGLLAIRQSIAAGVNITYKVLYNDAVAMTGGQRVGERAQGHTVLQIMHSLHAEGASKLVIVTNAPEKYAGVPLAAGVRVQHRDALERIQLELRTVPGTSVIIYDQTCATEKRRRRKRGHLTESDQYVVINAQVCEGCGDCGEVSNCLSVEPLETEFGRKRSINTSTCNHDLSCLKGFCPSFVTVKGGRLRKPDKHSQSALGHLADLPAPVWQTCNPVCSIVVAGIGGTGVITVGQVLGMAAHLDGKSVVTQDAGGLAQKGGATWSHVQFAAAPDAIFTSKVDHARADLVLGCDAVVAASATTLAVMQSGRTYVALNTHATPTASFVHQPDWQSAHAACTESIRSYVGAQALGMLDAQWVARKALGDSIYSNPLLLGYAWQQGRIPLSLAALMRAMEINGVQVQDNQLAFAWGRQCAHNLRAVLALFGDAVTRPANQQPSQEQCIALRVDHLTRYQNAAYAAGYLTLVRQVQQIDARWGADALSDAVAHNLCKVMAYKDEYEVARLYTDGLFAEQIATQFEGAYQLHFHLAPPGWAKKNANGELIKQTWGPATLRLLKWLARLKFLRGTVLDVFGRASERQQERRLIEDYRSCIGELLGVLAAGPDQPGAHERYALAVRIARVPEQIRGFGHVKARHQVAADTEWKTLMADFRQKV